MGEEEEVEEEKEGRRAEGWGVVGDSALCIL